MRNTTTLARMRFLSIYGSAPRRRPSRAKRETAPPKVNDRAGRINEQYHFAVELRSTGQPKGLSLRETTQPKRLRVGEGKRITRWLRWSWLAGRRLRPSSREQKLC